MKKKKSFTMIEILIITIVVGVGLLSIVFAVNKSKDLNTEIAQKVIANNLAKEWIEFMYQIRNTNLLQSSSPEQKNLCRLNENPYTSCNWENIWLTSWQYILTKNHLLSWTDSIFDLSNWLNNDSKQFAICISGNQWLSCPWEDNHSNYGKFFRVIEGLGLYDKNNNINWWNLLDCPNGNYNECNDETSKEYRFCSTVYYIDKNIWKVKICATMSNFFD